MNNDAEMYRYTAGIHAASAAEYLKVAHSVRDLCEVRAGLNMEWALTQMQKAADALGYDLVKREAPKVEEAA